MRAKALVLLSVTALAGCDQANMYTQGKASTWDRDNFLPEKTSMQLPVPGTVPRDEPNLPVPPPPAITVAMIERGHERYDIFCAPCHGLAGNGDGMIVRRGFPKPAPFTSDKLMKASAQRLYDVITDGKDTMYSFADRVPPADRWAIAAYIRALQLSQRPVVADLPAEDQAKLNEGAK